MDTKPYLTPNEAAALLMVAPATLRVWTDKGLIRALTTAGGHRRFPREEVERMLHARNPTDKAAGAQRVLIVDDEPSITRYLSLLLGGMGLDTAEAHDGFSAGQLVHTFHPHTLLLDLMMPGLDGFQVCGRIKAQPTTRHIRVIAMTGYPSPQNVERILAAGAETCLAKPLDEERLFAAMRLERGRT